MSKYDMDTVYTGSRNPALMPDETVLFELKPKKNAFVLNKSLTLAPIALIWLALDSFIITKMFSHGAFDEMWLFMIPFFALHLMPVWLWLGSTLTANRRWKNTVYYVTDRRLLIQAGFVAQDLETVYYKDIRNVQLRRGVIDMMLGVGDVHFDLGMTDSKGRPATKAFLDIENPQEVYNHVQKIVMDIQTDIHYPNGLRPEENPGYRTKYTGM